MRKVYHYRIVRTALLLLLASPAFVVLCLLLIAGHPSNYWIWLFALPGLLFFGAAFSIGLVTLPRMVRNPEALILTPEALILRQIVRNRPWIVPWREILGFSEKWIKGNHFVTLHLRTTPERIASERNVLKRWFMKANTWIAGSPYSIPADSLRCDPDELIATLVSYLEKYGLHERPDEGSQGSRPLDRLGDRNS